MSEDRELELGVPLPGRLFTPERWARTTWVDDGRPFDWSAVFGRDARHVVEIGSGSGRFLLTSAAARPDRDHLGVEVVPRLAAEAAERADRRGLTNVRVVAADAVPWLAERLGAGSVDELHIYHPQPYFRDVEPGERILTPEFLADAWRVLRPEGLFFLQSDHAGYFRYLREATAPWFEHLEESKAPWPDSPEGRTRREIVARRRGMVVRRLLARRRATPLARTIELAWPARDERDVERGA